MMNKMIPLAIGLVFVLCLPSLLYTGTYIVSDTPVPVSYTHLTLPTKA